jgi:hypothetical protein
VAIVTGIGDYANLPEASLPGIENDVDSMSAALSRVGFHMIRLFNAQATEEGIRGAFTEAAQRIHSGDRFVYYQSSHGSTDFHILTYNSTISGEHLLSSTDIKRLMDRIPTNRKSLILDACFSGGFQSRGGQFEKIKFYPIDRLKDNSGSTLHDRTDTVVRVMKTNSGSSSGSAYAVFASSQDSEPSLVVRIDGRICSVFTHFLVSCLESSSRSPWNTVVQLTIEEVQHMTQGRQTPVFDFRYLSALVFTTSDSGHTAETPVHNLVQWYDINNTNTSVLALTAKLEREPDKYGRFHPDTRVNLHIKVSQRGYLFVINRDDQDNAQMIGWGEVELDFNNPEKMVDQAYVSQAGSFEMGMGTLKITTSKREGFERWKALLFTSKREALKFAQLWNLLPADKSKRVRVDTFSSAKLADVERVPVQSTGGGKALYTSEIHYRVTAE